MIHPTTINITAPYNSTTLQVIFDQLAQAPRDHPLLIQMSATTMPLNLFHFLPSRCPTSELPRRIIDTALLINKITEIIFLHPKGAIASVLTPASGQVADKSVRTSGGFYLSGPLLVFASACAYRCVGLGISLSFEDVATCGLALYGGISHTLREWIGASLLVPMLVHGAQLSSASLSKGGKKNSSSNLVSPSAEAVKVLEDLDSRSVAVHASSSKRVGEDALPVAPSTEWSVLCDPANRLSAASGSYGTLISGVSWMKARKSLRVQVSISNSSLGRKGLPEVSALKLLTQKNVIAPMTAPKARGDSVAAFVGFVLRNEMSIFKSLVTPLNEANYLYNPPSYVAIYERFFSSQTIVSNNNNNNVSTSSMRIRNNMSPASSSSSHPVTLDHLTDPTEFALQLQRALRVQGDILEDQVRIYSLKQALISFSLEQPGGGRKEPSASSQPAISILLWDAPLNFEGNNIVADSLDFNMRYASELRSRFFLPEISCSSSPQDPKTKSLLSKVVNLLTSVVQSNRLAPPSIVNNNTHHNSSSSSSSSSTSILDKFPSLHLFAQLIRQAMLLIEDGAYPIVVHKSLQMASGMTPTVFDRIDRDCPEEGMRIIAKLVIASNESMGVRQLVEDEKVGSITSSTGASSSTPPRRSGTKLLDRMAELSLTDPRFRNFFRSWHRDAASTESNRLPCKIIRLDDVPLQKVVIELSEQEQRPRRVVSDEEINLRMMMVAGNFVTGGTGASDRVAGAVMGIQAYQGGSPMVNLRMKQFQSLQKISRSSSKKKSSSASQKSDDEQSSLMINNNPEEFANRLNVWAEATGTDALEKPHHKLIEQLKEVHKNVLLSNKSKL